VDEVDVAVVGSGFAGLLVARELVRAGRQVTVFERGGRRTHAEQIAARAHEVDTPGARHNHESAPGSDYPWLYSYGVGGSSLHWTGVTPRLLRSDFELRTRYGVGRDWPIRYDELVPYYREAEQILSVAGEAAALPPHALSPVDELVAPLLRPFQPLPQARASRRVNGRSACCGATTCELCPVDARFSMLHVLSGELARDGLLDLRDRTVVARLRHDAGRVRALETIDADGERATVAAGVVVLAANGIENPAILLRSGLDGPDVGRWLFDHGHRVVEIELNRAVPHGRGATLGTGMSVAYEDGDWRSERGAQLVIPFNPGSDFEAQLVDDVVAGMSGARVRERARRRFERRLVLDTLGEDLPQRERRVELSSRKDELGLPLNRIVYGRDGGYISRGRDAMYADLERRLRPLGGRIVATFRRGEGAHSLGTCHMAASGGVVDADQRHHRLENLFVTGGSAFPSYSARHPTLTICALAIRLGRRLAHSRRH
jgi:choline dehydrogenase-like flavoprotein